VTLYPWWALWASSVLGALEMLGVLGLFCGVNIRSRVLGLIIAMVAFVGSAVLMCATEVKP